MRIQCDAQRPIKLDAESAIDLTAMVSANPLQWAVPSGNWLVFGFWQRATGCARTGGNAIRDKLDCSSGLCV